MPAGFPLETRTMVQDSILPRAFPPLHVSFDLLSLLLSPEKGGGEGATTKTTQVAYELMRVRGFYYLSRKSGSAIRRFRGPIQ